MKQILINISFIFHLTFCLAQQSVPVILVAGQSNADGRVNISELPTDIHYNYCQWSYGSGDFLKADGHFKPFFPTVARTALGDCWGFDAIVYYLFEQQLQRPFYVIKQTMGGTAIDTTCTKSTHGWFWSVDADKKSLLKAFERQIDDCLPNLPKNYDIKCLIWHQGESDQPAADRYHDNLKKVINHLRQHLVEVTGNVRYTSLPVICGTFAKESRQGSKKVVDALFRLQSEDVSFHVVDANDLSLQQDQLHFDAQGAIILGHRVFEKLTKCPLDVWPVTDKSLIKSLNGEWKIKVIRGIDSHIKEVPVADASWSTIPVPGCWETYGFCEPKYDYPDSLTGYYRTSFVLPKEWKGQQVIIRLDGVLRGYDLWINDQLVGTWESGYNTCLFDLTPYLTKKAFKGEPQQLAMRVYSQFKGYEFDCFDDWATMGIFRDVTIFPVPKTHLSDLTVTTKMNGEVTVKTKVANATKHTMTDYEILDSRGYIVSTGEKIANPQLWTAETPYLYTLKVYVKEKGKRLQTFTQKIGIREISIDGNILKLNGQPIKLRGVNAHSTDPKTVKVISDELTLKDMKMMKEASINYMRLSHYPREPRFYELADSLGFYLVDEVPFGFGDKHLSNRGYQDILRTRALATVQRDKNHPSVIVWSVGNENPLPQTCVEVGDYVGSLDPSRPYCFPQVGSYFRKFFEGEKAKGFPSKAPVYAPHYPTTGQIAGFYQHLDRPVIFTEYCHTLGISFEDHDRQWEIIERTPGIAGGSVWEWADQGMPFRAPLKNRFGYHERVFTSSDGGFEMHGNKGTDGLVYADRTPLPNYFELQHNYARAFVSDVKDDVLTIVNRYDFLNLKDNVIFHWTLTNNRDTVMHGNFSPNCQPYGTVTYPLSLPKQNGLSLLQIDVEDAQGYTFLHQSFILNKPAMAWESVGDPMTVIQEGPLVRVGRKTTMAEELKIKNQRIKKYLQPIENPYVKADVKSLQEDNTIKVSYTLTPDTTDAFLSELGIAYLLDQRFDRVQWIGYGPFASYPGRHQANRYGFWAKHMDDLYFEGNHMGVNAAYFSDKDGNGLLVVGDSLQLNFEQTDRGIVMTVNAAVSGQGPKFSRTAFPVISKDVGNISGSFRLYLFNGNTFFDHPQNIPNPFHPFKAQYDTYLMKYNDIKP